VLDNLVIIGYSGHAFVVIEAAKQLHIPIIGYCEKSEVDKNPYQLDYLGNEHELGDDIVHLARFIIGIGDNRIRRVIAESKKDKIHFRNVIHPSAQISETVQFGEGIFVSANACVNASAKIGNHCIINTGSIVEHECMIGDYVHVAPGAVLAGNVNVGSGTFIGANATIKQGVKIGENVTIGAGAVVIRDIPNAVTVVGNPSKII